MGLRPGDRVTRPTTRFLCRWVPRRDPARRVDVAAAARFACKAIARGATKAEIDREIRRRCNVGDVECDCERVRLLLRQVLVAFAAVALALTLLTPARALIPIILTTIFTRLLPQFIVRQLPNLARGVRQLPDLSRTIEGVSVRIRGELEAIERAILR